MNSHFFSPPCGDSCRLRYSRWKRLPGGAFSSSCRVCLGVSTALGRYGIGFDVGDGRSSKRLGSAALSRFLAHPTSIPVLRLTPYVEATTLQAACHRHP